MHQARVTMFTCQDLLSISKERTQVSLVCCFGV